MKVALYQYHIQWEEKEANFQRVERVLQKAERDGVRLLLLPEMSFTGFSMRTELTAEREQETICRMRRLAAAYGAAVGFGWVRDTGEKAENHYTVVDRDGGILSDYVKIHPFSYSGEDQRFIGGTDVSSFVLEGSRFSTLICYDLRFPELFQIVSPKADVIVVAANWPQKRSAHWKTLLQARAIENQVYILGVNCVGEAGGLLYSGDSCVIAPDGMVIDMVSDREQLMEYELDNDTARYRSEFPVRADRREDLYARLAGWRK